MTDLKKDRVAEHPTGSVPTDWRVVTLGRLEADGIVEIKNGFAQGTHNAEGRGVPHLRPFNISDEGTIDLRAVKSVEPPDENSPCWLRTGDVVFNNTNSEEQVGKSAVCEVEHVYVLSNHMTILRIRDQSVLDPYWLARQMHYLWRTRHFSRLSRRYVNQSTVVLGRLRELEIVIPPIREQRAIALVFRRAQEVSDATQRLIDAARVARQSLRTYLLTYGAVPVGESAEVKLKNTDIGAVPSHWNVVPIANIGQIITGTTPSTANPAYYDGQYMFIAPGDIGEDKFVSHSQKTISEAGLAVSRSLPRGSVLVVCIGATIGKTALTSTDRSSTNQQINAVIPGDGIDSEFLYYAISSRAADLPGIAGRAAIPIVNKAQFGRFQVPLPPSKEQQKIAAALARLDAKLEGAKSRRRAVRLLVEALLPELITGRRRLTLASEVARS